MNLDRVIPKRLNPEQPLHRDGEASEHCVLNFWQWTTSDVLSNATRGVFAEYLVAQALNVTHKPRIEWSKYDLETDEGIKIEVKSSAYLQSWFQQRHSEILFGVAKKRSYNHEAGSYGEPMRHADVYVFALLKHLDKETVDPLNLNQWEFYILPTSEVNKLKHKSLRLKNLQMLTNSVPFEGIREAVEQAYQKDIAV